MKKWLLILIVFAGLSLTLAYVFFPREVDSSNIEKFNCNINSINRFLIDEEGWKKWWPGTITHDSISRKNIFSYHGYQFDILEKKYNAVVLQIRADNFTVEGSIFFIPMNIDTVRAEWNYALKTKSNPIYRVNLYWQTKKINENMVSILKSMKAFLENQVHIYGVKFYETMSNDSALIATKDTTKGYPSTGVIYKMISQLKKYIVSQEAKENNFPMLHIKKLNESEFETMVAIPVNKVLAGNGKLFYRRFVPWKVLAAEVRGGDYTVNEALKQMVIYRNDYNITAMAIPFASLVTDRSNEPDTLKWITRIYTPVP